MQLGKIFSWAVALRFAGRGLAWVIIAFCLSDKATYGQRTLDQLLDESPQPLAIKPVAGEGRAQDDGRASLGQRGDRLPVPAPAKVTAAHRKVREIFSGEIADAQTAEARLRLSVVLAAEAGRTVDPVEQWALWNEALRHSIDAGSFDGVSRIVADVAQRFDIDSEEWIAPALVQLAKKAQADTAEEIALACIQEGKRATGQSRFDDAEQLISAGQRLAQKMRNQFLLSQLRTVLLENRLAKKAAARLAELEARYEERPGDATVAAALGNHYCFELQEWEKGLPLIIKGLDPDLVQLARQDLSAGQGAGLVVAAADAWREWGRKQKPNIKAACNARAAGLYAEAIGQLNGLERTRAEKLMEEVVADGSKSAARSWVADTEPASVAGVAFGLTRDGTYEQKPYTCADENCTKSLRSMPGSGMKPATVTYAVPDGVKRLQGAAGVFARDGFVPGSRVGPKTPLFYELRVDGRLAWKSRGLASVNEVEEFDVVVAGAKQVEFITATESGHSAFAAWINPAWIK